MTDRIFLLSAETSCRNELLNDSCKTFVDLKFVFSLNRQKEKSSEHFYFLFNICTSSVYVKYFCLVSN